MPEQAKQDQTLKQTDKQAKATDYSTPAAHARIG